MSRGRGRLQRALLAWIEEVGDLRTTAMCAAYVAGRTPATTSEISSAGRALRLLAQEGAIAQVTNWDVTREAHWALLRLGAPSGWQTAWCTPERFGREFEDMAEVRARREADRLKMLPLVKAMLRQR
jgi:hypothetical protein